LTQCGVDFGARAPAVGVTFEPHAVRWIATREARTSTLTELDIGLDGSAENVSWDYSISMNASVGGRGSGGVASRRRALTSSQTITVAKSAAKSQRPRERRATRNRGGTSHSSPPRGLRSSLAANEAAEGVEERIDRDEAEGHPREVHGPEGGRRDARERRVVTCGAPHRERPLLDLRHAPRRDPGGDGLNEPRERARDPHHRREDGEVHHHPHPPRHGLARGESRREERA